MTTDIATLLAWGEPKRLNTRFGERILRIAPATAEFRKLWRLNKEVLQTAGLSWERKGEQFTGNVAWWTPVSEAQRKQEERIDKMSRATKADIDVPAPKGLNYFPFQKAAIAYALEHPNTLLADQMGIGKSIESIGVINALSSIKSVLVICPASLKLNWRRELRKWLVRPMPVNIVNRDRLGEDAPVQIINYDIVAAHREILERQWDLLIADEAHYIKTPAAKRTRAVCQIKAHRKLLLTGTPILNRPVELIPLLAILDPEKWGSQKAQWQFKFRYCNAYKDDYGVWNVSGASRLRELQKILRQSVMIRRLKADVLAELPPKLRSVIDLEVDENVREIARCERERYDELEAQKAEAERLKTEAEVAGNKEAFEAAVQALKAIEGVAFEEMAKLRHETAQAKCPAVIDYCREILENSDQKLVIFAWHQDIVASIKEALAAYNPVTVIGGQSDKSKDDAVTLFQMTDTCRVFIGNIVAAGTGLTLTASSHVVFAELDWTPARLSQAEDRCHRIGQADYVQVEHLVIDGSLDARMAQMLIEKQDIIDRALDEKEVVQPELAIEEPIERVELKTELPKVPMMGTEFPELTEIQLRMLLRAMRMLAHFCDGAKARDHAGFDAFDTTFGHILAQREFLTQEQGVVAYRYAKKYWRQLPGDLLVQIGIEPKLR